MRRDPYTIRSLVLVVVVCLVKPSQQHLDKPPRTRYFF
jgi:hypothetical protein